MGEVVIPLCASSPSSMLSTFTVSYQNVTQSFKVMLSFFNKFRWAMPWRNSPSSNHWAPLTGYDLGWCVFTFFPFCCTNHAFLDLTRGSKVVMTFIVLKGILNLGAIFLHILVMYSILYWYLEMPFKLIGAKAKFMIEVIPMTTAAALHYLSVSNYVYLILMLGCTTYFYTIVHFMHVAYDIRAIDVLLGIVMQVLAYTLNADLLVRALVLSFCFGLCFYRYMTYSAPELPAHPRKEMELLPC